MKNYNRINEVLTERRYSVTWLSEQVGVSVPTASRWARNLQQPSIPMLFKIADVFDLEAKTLLVTRKELKEVN